MSEQNFTHSLFTKRNPIPTLICMPRRNCETETRWTRGTNELEQFLRTGSQTGFEPERVKCQSVVGHRDGHQLIQQLVPKQEKNFK